jgi:hypothetical protein
LWSNWWNEDWQGKPKYSEKTCPSATLSTTNPTWADPGANTGRRGGKPATNRLSYGAAKTCILKKRYFLTGVNGMCVCVCVCVCGGEGQLECEYLLEPPPVQEGVSSSSQTPSVV